MHVHAELVKSVLRWSLSVVAREDLSGTRHAGPRLSQFCLGNLLARTDFETCAAIAKEIAELEKADQTDTYMASLRQCVRDSWGEKPRERVHRTGAEDAVWMASKMCTTLHNFSTERDQNLLETCSSAKSWKQTETVLKGRDWHSIRDDFEIVARRFYLKEQMTICEVAEFITERAQNNLRDQ